MFQFENFCRGAGLDYVTEGHHHCSPGWIQVHCPFCDGGKSGFHLGFSIESGGMSCWICGRQKLREFLKKKSPWGLRETFARYGGVPGRPAPYKPRPKIKDLEVHMPEGTGPMEQIHRKYLRSRGFSPKEIYRNWGVQGTGQLGPWRNRLVIPIFSRDSELVSWTTRSVNDKSRLRYKSCSSRFEKQNHKTILYGENYVQRKSVIVVEGPLDVWRIGAGYAVATFGVSLTNEQIVRLSNYERIILALDPDTAGEQAMSRIGNSLAVLGVEVIRATVNSSNGKDWADTQDKTLLTNLRKLVV